MKFHLKYKCEIFITFHWLGINIVPRMWKVCDYSGCDNVVDKLPKMGTI